MAQPTFEFKKQAGILKLNFEIPGGNTTPEEFATAVEAIESQLVGPFVVAISGRGPVWGYGMLIHAAHASKAVATNDPRLGYVVIQSHNPSFTVGQVLSIEE